MRAKVLSVLFNYGISRAHSSARCSVHTVLNKWMNKWLNKLFFLVLALKSFVNIHLNILHEHTCGSSVTFPPLIPFPTNTSDKLSNRWLCIGSICLSLNRKWQCFFQKTICKYEKNLESEIQKLRTEWRG